jgi:hypothetical protein
VSKSVSMRNVFRVLSDQQTERFFKAIIDSKDAESQILILESGLSKRQYYYRTKNLLKAGLIWRQKGRYELSSFGKVILSLYKIAEKASKIYWKLDAIDNIKMSEKSHLAEIDYMNIVNVLLNDTEIKEFFFTGEGKLIKTSIHDCKTFG